MYLGGAGHGGFQNEILSFRIRFWIFRRDYFGNEIDFPEEDDPIYRMTVRVYSRAKLGIVFTFQAKDEALEYQEVDDCRPWEFWELNHRLQKECMRALMKLLFYKWAAPHVKVIQWLLENNYEAKDVFNKNMVLLYELTVERHVWLDNNPEIRDLMFRILDLEFSPEKPRKKPYEKSAKDWKDWLVCFRNRFDYTLPKLPPRVEVFLHAMRVDRAIEFFEDKIEDLIIEVSGPLAKKRLADEEDYRVRRGLLLFHFYCMLSHQPRDNPDANIDSRVAEQASFLQTLPPWLIAELESIYSLLETIICHHFRICCVARTSLPLHPNRSSRPSTPRIEYLMSQGLIKLRKVLEKTEYGHGNLMKDVPFVDDDQNDFFSTAMKKCWKWQKLNDGSRMPIYPRTMPRDQEHINFDKVPLGSNSPSFPYRALHGQIHPFEND